MSTEYSLIAKMVGHTTWRIVQNPDWAKPSPEYYAAQMLENPVIEYVQWVNGGTIYRAVRSVNLNTYKL